MAEWRAPERRPPNPPVRVDDYVIYADGTSRRLTKGQMRALDRGDTLFLGTTGFDTRTVGDEEVSERARAYWAGRQFRRVRRG